MTEKMIKNVLMIAMICLIFIGGLAIGLQTGVESAMTQCKDGLREIENARSTSETYRR